MPMKEQYYTVDGQLIGYKDAAGRKDFLTDVLGSVTGEVDQTGTNRTFNGRYMPYGRALWITGSGGSFGWIGSLGYRSINLKETSHYVRARHYSNVAGQWTSQDLIWPNDYSYVNSRPTASTDPSGLTPNLSYLLFPVPPRTKTCSCPKPTSFAKILWIFIGSEPLPDGAIVQHLTRRLTGSLCSGKDPFDEEPPSFFEAWEVKGGKIFHGHAMYGIVPGVDPWDHQYDGKCKIMTQEVTAHAKFIPGQIISGWPRCTNKDNMADLPCILENASRTFKDKFFASKGNSVRRNMTMNSTCCDYPKECEEESCSGSKGVNKCTIKWTP